MLSLWRLCAVWHPRESIAVKPLLQPTFLQSLWLPPTWANKRRRPRRRRGTEPGNVAVYKSGDTLVSNIRPYFKKIWYADRSGTCSGDVLVFRANQPEHAGYLYSCLRQDRFFDYVMKGAKGTKMPRGDKKQMLTYEIVNSPSAAAIGAIQTALEQISIANKENDS